MGAYGPPPGFYRNSPFVKISEDYCVGCLKCIEVCPRDDVLRARKMEGRARAYAIAPDRCVGCGRCVHVCPTHCMSVCLT